MAKTAEDLLGIINSLHPAKKEKEEEQDNEDNLTAMQRYESYLKGERVKQTTGAIRSVGEGLTLGWWGELESRLYDNPEEALIRIRDEQARYKELYPKTDLGLELIAGVVSGGGVAKSLGSLGVKSAAKQAGIEMSVYGAGSGESDQDRLLKALIYGAGGALVGKGIDKLTGYSPKVKAIEDTVDEASAPTTDFSAGGTVSYTTPDGIQKTASIVEELDDGRVLVNSNGKTYAVSKEGLDVKPGLRAIDEAPEGPATMIQLIPEDKRVKTVKRERVTVTEDPPPPVSFNTRTFNLNPARERANVFVDQLANDFEIPVSSLPKIIYVDDFATQSNDAIADFLLKGNATASQKDALVKRIAAVRDSANKRNLDGFAHRFSDDIPEADNLIVVGTTGNSLETAQILTHEFGHDLVRSTFNKAKTNPMTSSSLLDEFNKPKNAAYKSDLEKIGYSEDKIFEEWFVDNVALWATKRWAEKPTTRAERFFKATAAKLRMLTSKAINMASGFTGKSRRSVGEAGANTRTADGLINPNEKVNEYLNNYLQEVQRRRIKRKDVDVEYVRSFEEVPEVWDNSKRSNLNAKGWREATNAGEFVDGLKNSLIKFYEDNLVGMSDRIARRVSKQVGARIQRADEAALKISARDVEDFVDPIEPTAALWADDDKFAGMLLNYAAGRRSKDSILEYVKDKLGAEQAGLFNRYLNWSDLKNAEHQMKVSGKKYARGGSDYLSTRLTAARKAEITKSEIERRAEKDGITFNEAKKLYEEEMEMTLPLDGADYRLKRGDAETNEVNLADYENPILSNTKRIINNERLVQYAEKFGVYPDSKNLTPESLMDAIEQAMVKRGINPEAATFTRNAIVENIIGQGKSPNGWIQALQSIGYAGTLAGPKSALLNIHDVPQTVVTQGRASLKGLQDMDLKRFGITNQNFGEFQNRLNDEFGGGRDLAGKAAKFSRQATDALMKVSGFKLMDEIGKKGVTSMILKRNVDDVMSGKGLKEEWGFYFNEAELRTIERAMKKHGMDFNAYTGKSGSLVEELVMAGLGQQQLISGAGRPAGWARNPNLRPLWALRGFAVKQQALAYKNVIENIQDGNTEAAVKWAGQYLVWSAGTYGAINEVRQGIFGDGNIGIEGYLRGVADQVAGVTTLNTIGFNDYQYGKLKREGILSSAWEGVQPPFLDIPISLLGKSYGVITGEGNPSDILPLTKQIKRAAINTGMLTGD